MERRNEIDAVDKQQVLQPNKHRFEITEYTKEIVYGLFFAGGLLLFALGDEGDKVSGLILMAGAFTAWIAE